MERHQRVVEGASTGDRPGQRYREVGAPLESVEPLREFFGDDGHDGRIFCRRRIGQGLPVNG
ncbi:MAG: hypothetical protein OXU63_07130 [Acidobacteriota bacterium]|nr:hypothetical protein [Acidobacteriota bacterium]